MSEAKKQRTDDVAFGIMQGFFKVAMDPDFGPEFLAESSMDQTMEDLRKFMCIFPSLESKVLQFKQNQLENQNSTQLSNL